MSVTKSPFREMFPRLFELKEADPSPTHPDTYLHHLEGRLENERVPILVRREWSVRSVCSMQSHGVT